MSTLLTARLLKTDLGSYLPSIVGSGRGDYGLMRKLSREKIGVAMYTDGIKVDPSEHEVKEAIDLGAKNKDSPESIHSLYCFGGGIGRKEYGFVATKFYTLAFLGCRLAKRYKNPEREEIEEILNSKELWIGICTYGDKIDFAENYHIVLTEGRRVIQPVNHRAPQWTKTTASYPASPSYEATIIASFPYSKINPKAKATIVLIKDRGKSSFKVDLSRYK